MRATIRDIARNLELSHSTVSKALNRHKDSLISESTRKRVESEADRLGYRPNHAARALVTGRTGFIGLGIGDFFHSYNVSVMHHVEHHLRIHGYQMLVQRFREPKYMSRLLDWPMDGLITLDYPGHVQTLLKSSLASLPIVSMGTFSAEHTDHVTLDLFPGTQGYTRILYVVNEWGLSVPEPRRDAYFETLSAAGLEPQCIVLQGATREEGYLVMQSYLAANPVQKRSEKTAFFCLNDSIAVGCYRALRESGLRIPEDVGVIGCDDSEDIQYLECPLSSISYSISDLCSTALNFLEARIANPALERQKAVVTSRFVSRKFTQDG